MSWREDLKVGLLRADELYIGTANGGLGSDVTAALLTLAGLGGGALVTDIQGDVQNANLDTVLSVEGSGTFGPAGVVSELRNTVLTSEGFITPGVVQLFNPVSAVHYGNLALIVDESGNYIDNVVEMSACYMSYPSVADPTVQIQSQFLQAVRNTSDDALSALLTGVNLIDFYAEDANNPGALSPVGTLIGVFDTSKTGLQNYLQTQNFQGDTIESNRIRCINDPNDVLYMQGGFANVYVAASVVAQDLSPITESIANPFQNPASIADTKIMGSQLVGFPVWSMTLADQAAAPGPDITLDVFSWSYNTDNTPIPVALVSGLLNGSFAGAFASLDMTATVVFGGATAGDAWAMVGLQAMDSAYLLESIATPGTVPASVIDSKITVNAVITNGIDSVGGLLVTSGIEENNFFTGMVQALNGDKLIHSIATPAETATEKEDAALEVAHIIPLVDDGASKAWDGKTTIIPIASGATITAFTPAFVGQRVTIWCADSTADATLVCGAGVTFDGTNDVATFADDDDAIEVVAVSLTRWLVTSNIGAVAFS